MEDTESLIKEIQKLQRFVSSSFLVIESHLDALPLFARETFENLKIFSECLDEYRKIIEAHNSNLVVFYNGCSNFIYRIQHCWKNADLDGIKPFVKKFQALHLDSSARIFIFQFQEIYKLLPIINLPQPMKENILDLPPGIDFDKHFAQLYTHCLAINDLLYRRRKFCPTIKLHLKNLDEGFRYYIKHQIENIQTQELNLNELKRYLADSNMEYGFSILKELVDEAPLGNWCARLIVILRTGQMHPFRDRSLETLFENGPTLIREDDRNEYEKLTTERQLISFLQKFDDFLLTGFLTIDALSLLDELVDDPSKQEKLEQYQTECKWYCKIVLNNIEFIMSKANKLDEDIIKKLILLFELVVDQLGDDNPDVGRFKNYIDDLKSPAHQQSSNNSPRH